MKRGKKYSEAAKLVDSTMLYDAADAIDLVQKTSTTKFDATVEAHIRLGVDSRHADQQVRGAVVLPHGTGKTVRVLEFDIKRPIQQDGVMTTMPQSVKAPFIGLVPIPSLLIDRVDVDFQMEVTDTSNVKSTINANQQLAF